MSNHVELTEQQIAILAVLDPTAGFLTKHIAIREFITDFDGWHRNTNAIAAKIREARLPK